MKTTANIHLLPTDKESRIYACRTGGLGFYKEPHTYTIPNQGRHMYITLPQSDLEISKIKEGDWFIFLNEILRS